MGEVWQAVGSGGTALGGGGQGLAGGRDPLTTTVTSGLVEAPGEAAVAVGRVVGEQGQLFGTAGGIHGDDHPDGCDIEIQGRR